MTEVNGHLASRVNQVKDRLISRLQGRAEPGAALRILPLGGKSIHQIGIVEVSSNNGVVRCFVKGNVPNYQGGQKLDVEHHLLSEIAPLIANMNEKIQCPRVVAFFPQEELLFLEMIDGRALKSILFDLIPSRPDLQELLSLSGEWLGRLHRMTQGGEANPFDWLEGKFEADRIRSTFEKCGVQPLYRTIRQLLQDCGRTYQGCRRPLCQLHGEFTPLHVLVKDDSIFVIDFGSSTRGFACEDVALFTTFYENLQPWRSATGWFRVPFREQKDSFLASYSQHCGQEFQRMDEVIARFTRIWAMARHEFFWERKPASWHEGAYLTFGRPWMRKRFAAFAGRETRKVQNLASAGSVPLPALAPLGAGAETGAMFRPPLKFD